MPYHTDAALAPGSPAGVVMGRRTVDIRDAASNALNRAAFAVATAGGSRDAAHDEEGAEPVLARRSRTGISIPVQAVRILDTSHLLRELLSRGGTSAAACPGTGQNTGANEAECLPAISAHSPEPRHTIKSVPVHIDSPSCRRPSLSATPREMAALRISSAKTRGVHRHPSPQPRTLLLNGIPRLIKRRFDLGQRHATRIEIDFHALAVRVSIDAGHTG